MKTQPLNTTVQAKQGRGRLRFVADVAEQFDKTTDEAERVADVYVEKGLVEFPFGDRYVIKSDLAWTLVCVNGALCV